MNQKQIEIRIPFFAMLGDLAAAVRAREAPRRVEAAATGLLAGGSVVAGPRRAACALRARCWWAAFELLRRCRGAVGGLGR